MGKQKEITKLGQSKFDAELADLIDKGFAADKRKKRAENELKKLKAAIKQKVKNKEGRWQTPAGSYLVVSAREQFEEIDPVEAFTFLKSKRRGPSFFHCIKVLADEFKQYADRNELNRLRPYKGDTLTFSFKQGDK